jgi:hypothetical protein
MTRSKFHLTPPAPNRAPVRGRKKGKKAKKRGNNKNVMNHLSQDGREFLKCATAMPDFDVSNCAGIPDEYGGRTAVKQDFATTNISAAAGQSTYIMTTPTPGTAYWTTSIAIGDDLLYTNAWTPVSFPDTAVVFPNSVGSGDDTDQISNATNFDKFRYVGMSAELVCTTNQLNWAGSINAWKTPMDLTTTRRASSEVGVNLNPMHLTGIDGVRKATLGSNVFSGTTSAGVYSTSLNRDPEFEFQPIRDGEYKGSVTIAPYAENPPTNTSYNEFDGPVLGWGNSDVIVFRIDVPLGAQAQSFVVRNWATLEYQVTQASLFHQFSHASATYDPCALVLYKEIADNLPIAVIQADNSKFWKRVLSIVKAASGALSVLPGPAGVIAKGVYAGASLF